VTRQLIKRNIWLSHCLGAVVRFFSAMVAMLLLSGCGLPQEVVRPNYVRTDGAPVNESQEQATLAQCKGEAAAAPPTGALGQQMKMTEACMARNGYIQK
jgi:hypothetical protein